MASPPGLCDAGKVLTGTPSTAAIRAGVGSGHAAGAVLGHIAVAVTVMWAPGCSPVLVWRFDAVMRSTRTSSASTRRPVPVRTPITPSEGVDRRFDQVVEFRLVSPLLVGAEE